MINKKEIEKLAFLARLRLDDEERNNVPKELESILQYIQKLGDIDTEDVDPLFHFPELKNIVRKDEIREVERKMQKRMMRMGKDKDDYLKVEFTL